MPFDGATINNPDIATIDRMREILATPDRWCKGLLYDGRGRRCLLGAALAATDHVLTVPAGLYDLMQAEARMRGFPCVPSFNNAPATKHADILNFLDAVRARLEVCNAV